MLAASQFEAAALYSLSKNPALLPEHKAILVSAADAEATRGMVNYTGRTVNQGVWINEQLAHNRMLAENHRHQ